MNPNQPKTQEDKDREQAEAIFQNRRKKALKLIEGFRTNDPPITAAMMEKIQDQSWWDAAGAAVGIKSPSVDTQKLVLEMLRGERE